MGYVYPGGNDLGITLNFMWQCQTKELAEQGMTAEYEDMLDHELLTLWALSKEINRDVEISALLESGLNEPDKIENRKEWASEKRKRCWNKKRLAMEIAHHFKFTVTRVPDFDADMDDYQKFFNQRR